MELQFSRQIFKKKKTLKY